jgi:hypothetical protein
MLGVAQQQQQQSLSVSVGSVLAAPQHPYHHLLQQQQQQGRSNSEDQLGLAAARYHPGDVLVVSPGDVGGDWSHAMGACWDVDSLANSAASLLVLDDTLLAAHNSANLLSTPLELTAVPGGMPALGSSSSNAAAQQLVGLEEVPEDLEMLQVPLTPGAARLVAGNMACISSASGARLALSPAAGSSSLLLTLTGALGQLLEARQLVKALLAPSPAAWMG